jgi:hypothetical protein
LSEIDDLGDQQRTRNPGEEQSETDINNILDARENYRK